LKLPRNQTERETEYLIVMTKRGNHVYNSLLIDKSPKQRDVANEFWVNSAHSWRIREEEPADPASHGKGGICWSLQLIKPANATMDGR
jgi:hypothetical protein